MKIKVKIKRLDPAGGLGAEHYFQAYDVEATTDMTVLEALLRIADEQDPTLSFRKSCRSAICGSCAMKVNGFTKLACNTLILPEHKKHSDMVLEPLGNHTVLKDLIVDFDTFWKKMDRVKPYLVEREDGKEVKVTQKDAAAINDAQKCIMCGVCNSECNALEIDGKYLAPAALAKAWRFVGDVREEGAGRPRIGRLSDDHGMWDCVRCIHCTQYCPKDVKPLQAIERLRSRAIAEKITNNYGAKHVEAMVESVKKVGRLDEAAMTFKTLGFLKSLGMIPLGLKMELHGKMPHPHIFAQIQKIDEVRTIYNEIERKRRKRAKEQKKK